MRTYVYIDGFNLYYAIRNTPYKWLNLKALAEKVLPHDCQIERVKYYTARLSGAADIDQPRRQQIYLNALKTVREIDIYFGSFLAKNVWRPLLNLPVADREIRNKPPVTFAEGDYVVRAHKSSGTDDPERLSVGHYPTSNNRSKRQKRLRPAADTVKAQVHWMEEKGSDVNLACHLINDAWRNSFDVAAVISNDTDLVEPIRIATAERRKQVIVVCPGPWDCAPALAKVATSTRHINRAILKAAQFPARISRTNIRKPAQWQ